METPRTKQQEERKNLQNKTALEFGVNMLHFQTLLQYRLISIDEYTEQVETLVAQFNKLVNKNKQQVENKLQKV